MTFRFQFVSPMWDDKRFIVERCVIPFAVEAKDADEAMRKVSKALTDLVSATEVPEYSEEHGLFPWTHSKPVDL